MPGCVEWRGSEGGGRKERKREPASLEIHSGMHNSCWTRSGAGSSTPARRSWRVTSRASTVTTDELHHSNPQGTCHAQTHQTCRSTPPNPSCEKWRKPSRRQGQHQPGGLMGCLTICTRTAPGWEDTVEAHENSLEEPASANRIAASHRYIHTKRSKLLPSASSEALLC